MRLKFKEKMWTRDDIRNIVKPYLKAIGAKKARVDYIGFNDKAGFKFTVNNSHMTEKELESFNQEHCKTFINLNTMKGSN